MMGVWSQARVGKKKKSETAETGKNKIAKTIETKNQPQGGKTGQV